MAGATHLTGERADELPDALTGRNLARRAFFVVTILAVVGVVIALAPGLGEIRHELSGLNGWWIAGAVVLEILSSASYVLLFRPVFCPSMPWKLSNQISWSEVGVGSIVPASGIGGLALGAWVLRQAGMSTNLIARRSVAFFLIKGSVNFILVAFLGIGMAVGLFGPDLSPWLTAFPAALALLIVGGVVAIPRLGHGAAPRSSDSRLRHAIAAGRNALVDGSAEAIRILRARNWMAIAGAVGYYAFDNAMMWATYKAVGVTLPLSVLMMGYLIGQLGGLLPLPGGIGGVDGGLIGSLVVYGAPAAATATAVLAFRVVLFWVPLIGGAIAFAGLRRSLATMDTKSVCRAGVQRARA